MKEPKSTIPQTRPAEAIETLLGRCLEVPETEQDAAVEELCCRYPDLASRLRSAFAQIRSLGLSQTPGERDALPEIEGIEIRDKLGAGGMGDVYLGHQLEPVQRDVAVKLVRRGMDTRQVLARFELERQALARMSHPCIAQVFGAGSTAAGSPYFVMELVDGEPIHAWCRSRDLDQRIDLFIQVCEGVQHAHQKGIIHRDLKPSNVMVVENNGRPMPKIIDFGIAKATEEKLTADSLYTAHGALIGTPEYMSPEQAAGDPEDVDTRSDVYALGVMLYELLTDQLPFPSGRLRQMPLPEIVRVIREETPPRPSTRIRTLGEYAGEDPGRISTRARWLRGDLDWITMRAMEKDRARRYETAQALADDLSRFRRHEPVHAGPPSALYRLSKFARRNRTAVSAAVVVFVVLVAGVTATIWEGQRAEANLARYERLKDLPQAERLLWDAEHTLWPASPAQIPALRAWLAEAEALSARAAGHRARLDTLRRRAGPITPAAARKLADLALLQENLDRVEASIREPDNVPYGLELERRRLRADIATVEADLEALRWRFDDPEDRLRHGILTQLVRDLEQLGDAGGVIARVRTRLQAAADVRAKSLDHPAWPAAVAAVGAADGVTASTKYRGMPALRPQLGLVPIGMDRSSKLWEFAVLGTGAVPARDPDTGALRIEDDTAVVLVLLPGGEAWLGAQDRDVDRPNHDPAAAANQADASGELVRARLDPFFLSKFEMTQAQWQRIRRANPSAFPAGVQDRLGNRGASWRHPVENVSWEESEETMRRVALELPTEAQWEYAARAGTGTPWSCGAQEGSLMGSANIADATLRRFDPGAAPAFTDVDDAQQTTTRVGHSRANGFGLHDVVGNVAEWCRDPYGDRWLPPQDGDGHQERTGVLLRVHRGGAWNTPAEAARSASRAGARKTERNSGIGLRPARRLES